MHRILSSGLASLLTVFFVLLGANAYAASALERIVERGTLVLGTSGNMPTMTQIDANGKLSGFDIDLASLMASSMGVKLEARVIEFSKLIPALQSGEIDLVISNMTITPERNLKVAFVGPYMESGKCIVTRDPRLAGAEAEAEESAKFDIPETRLAVLGGSTSERFARALLPQATLIKVSDFQQAAELVKSDQAHGLLTDYPVCLGILKDNPDAGFVTVFSLLTYEPIGIALPANDAQFINWTENFLQRAEGTQLLEKLGEQWFGKVKFGR